MVVTLNTILDGALYEPRVGTEYEVAPGKTVKLRAPTPALVEAAGDEYAREGATDLSVARIVADGDFGADDERLDDVVAEVVLGFTRLLGEMQKRRESLRASIPSAGQTQPGA